MVPDIRRAKLERYLSLQQVLNFPYLSRLVFQKRFDHNGVASCDVEVSLAEHDSAEGRQLRVKFIQAVEIRTDLRYPGLGWHLEIQDIADRQLEDIVYKVVESEDNLLCLNCRDFEFEIAES